MTRKTSQSYVALFEYIETKLFKLNPTNMMTDFENGLRKAIKQCWPNCSLHGCWFHFCRAIQRRVRKRRLFKLLKRNRKAKRIYKSLMSLPLLPEEHLVEGYNEIKKLARKSGLFKQFSDIFSYFERQWMKEVISPAKKNSFVCSSVHLSICPSVWFSSC